jgi:uncharacterized membrane protein YeaQ/YmgE (transglycosylase-associated protein family)
MVRRNALFGCFSQVSGSFLARNVLQWLHHGATFRSGSQRRADNRRKTMPEGIIQWLLIGLVAGALGKLIMPGKDPGGIIVTILIGIAGALLAFYLTPMLGVDVSGSSWKAYAAATAGAVVLLALYRLVMTRRA